jgi:hypothetical protein
VSVEGLEISGSACFPSFLYGQDGIGFQNIPDQTDSTSKEKRPLSRCANHMLQEKSQVENLLGLTVLYGQESEGLRPIQPFRKLLLESILILKSI